MKIKINYNEPPKLIGWLIDAVAICIGLVAVAIIGVIGVLVFIFLPSSYKIKEK